MDFMDILLEAPRPKKPATTTAMKADTGDSTDYTKEEESPEEVEETGDDEPEEDDEPTDYTEEEDESDPEEDGLDEDETPEDDEEGTDYTEETPDEDGETPEDDTSGENTEAEGEQEDESNERENNRILLDDTANLYFLTKNTITKLSNVDKSNILINKIITQISSNLIVLKKQLHEYITFKFSKSSYVTNLYKYNYFLEAFRLNIEMLKKISIFIPN